jgi:hypothetical protein
MFCSNEWLHGQHIADLAPSLLAAIPQRRRQRQTVQAALLNHAWISNIQGNLTVAIIVEYIELWDLLEEVQLQQDVDDTHIWRLYASGLYSVKSAYHSLFLGVTMFKAFERI